MIGDVRKVLEVISEVEGIGVDVKRLTITEDYGLIRIEFDARLPKNDPEEQLEKLKELLSRSLDSYGMVLRNGQIVSVSGYILSGKSPEL